VKSVLVALFAAATAAVAAEPVAIAGRAMGTTWLVKWLQPTSVDEAIVARRVAARLEELEQQFSTYRSNSELSRFNAAPATTEWVPVSAELARVAVKSAEVSALTGGAFDVTVDPLVRLWGFGPAGRREVGVPSDAEISAARQQVGWQNLSARPEPPALRRTRPGVTVDFSSMAKGFAADEMSALLAALGCANHFVQVGGDVRTAGVGAVANEWRTGIESAVEPGSVACVVGLAGQAVSTSGNYRNFIVRESVQYGHIIDPRTGRPASGTLAAVSVIHASCAMSSALATALFVLGADAGFELAQREGLACLFTMRGADGIRTIRRMTSEFERRLR
jgi:FAD:protein FMN transferase